MNLLLIDNYDSFTYNLVQYFGELGATLQVVENDQISLAEMAALHPDYLCISPGPGHPQEAGISCTAIDYFSGKIPILGVCLGHQCIATAFGGRVVKAARQLHGKTSLIEHDGKEIFKDLPHPFFATRYHSLIVDQTTFPDSLEIRATTEEGEIMGLRHRLFPVWGVQFHPESILTTHGKKLLKNFLELK
jgi:anthranilate synthase/aminodeoxychorismate synthase-like glutamine amidotransferase